MDPYSGDVYQLREQLLDAAVGDRVAMDEYRRRVDEVGFDNITEQERAALSARALVRVEEDVARRLTLGNREQRRRQARRKRRTR